MTFSPFRHLGSAVWKKRPIQFTFFLTRRCNARCPFCFYISKQDREGTAAAELSPEEIEKFAPQLGKLLWLAFSGGEIFLRSDLVDITKLFYRINQPAIILLPSNGLLQETIVSSVRSILQGCPESSIVVKLSLDGPESIHDELRGVPGAYRKTLATCEALGELVERYGNFELGINTVFCRANEDNMDEVIDLVQTMPWVKTHTVSLIRGEVLRDDLKQVDPVKYEKVIGRLESDLKKRSAAIYRFRGGKLKAAQDILQRRLIAAAARQTERTTPCYAGRLNLVLTETGDLYPCEDFSARMRFGNVRKSGYDLQRLLQSDKGREVLDFIDNKGCHCTHECYFMTNILFNPRRYPALLKEYLQL
ncbi:MAG: 4Fe-4S cluster-binding domain-containing protein [Deltaproteobacteria bacterium]|jgi:radical SAM protein with 4Fe4S-binding SPASM domain|nr:4Fe-4S cluster-binding domain-containing protein [Deltaproteobacteria bacterium]